MSVSWTRASRRGPTKLSYDSSYNAVSIRRSIKFLVVMSFLIEENNI